MSLEPPQLRKAGYLSEQVNMRSDRLHGLVRRPPMLWHGAHTYGTTTRPKHHRYRRNNKEYEILIDPNTGQLRAYIDGLEQVIDGEGMISRLYISAGYDATKDNLRLQTVEDRTYIINTARTVGLTTTGVPARGRQTSHINVVSASNYEDRITVRVSPVVPAVGPQVPVDIGSFEATIQIPSAGAANADYWRGTSKVAEEIGEALLLAMREEVRDTDRWHNGIDADYPYQIHIQGSTVGIYAANGGVYRPIVVELISENKNIEVFNETVESVEGIPKYAIEGSIVKIQPDPSSNIGVYYLQAHSSVREFGAPQEPNPNTKGSHTLSPWGESATGIPYLQECTWVEVGDPSETERINHLQMPIELNMDTLTLTESTIDADRLIGDSETHPWPTFVGTTINDVAYMQKRLIFVSDGAVDMTRIEKDGYPTSFWHKSATSTLVTDPVSITPSATGVDALRYAQPHNKDLLITAANMQLKIGGSSGITPQTVSMAPTTSLDVSTDVPPLMVGSDVYFTFPYTQSSGLLVYSGQQNIEQDGANVLTDHVQGYLAGRCKLLVASPTLRMLALTADDPNTIFINEYDRAGKYTGRNAWHKWTIPSNHTVINMWFVDDVLHIRTLVGSTVHTQSFELAQANDASTVYVDNQFRLQDTLTSDADTSTIPDYPDGFNQDPDNLTGYSAAAYVPLGGGGELQEIGTFTNGTFQHVSGDPRYVPDLDVIVGVKYRSKITLSGAAKHDQEGVPLRVKRVRHKRSLIGLVNSGDMTMDITGTSWESYVAKATTLGQTQIGRVTNTSRQVVLPYSGVPDLNQVKLYTDELTPLNITTISWFGDIVEY